VKWAEGRSGGWLELSAEATVLREVPAARVTAEAEDEERDRRLAEQNHVTAQIMRALETCGVRLAVRPEDIKERVSRASRAGR
jgi:hypothetical protein